MSDFLDAAGLCPDLPRRAPAQRVPLMSWFLCALKHCLKLPYLDDDGS